jgi:hypothetical protein
MAIVGSRCGHTTFDLKADDVLEEDVPLYEDRDGEAQVAELSDEPFEVREGGGDQVCLPSRGDEVKVRIDQVPCELCALRT